MIIDKSNKRRRFDAEFIKLSIQGWREVATTSQDWIRLLRLADQLESLPMKPLSEYQPKTVDLRKQGCDDNRR